MYRCLLWSFWLSYLAFSFGYVSNLQIFQILSLSHIDPLIIEDDDPALSQSVINFVTPGIQKVREDDVMESLSQTLLRFVTQAEKLRSIFKFWISVVLSKRRHTLWYEFLNFIFKINFSVFSKLRVVLLYMHQLILHLYNGTQILWLSWWRCVGIFTAMVVFNKVSNKPTTNINHKNNRGCRRQ